MNGAVIPHPPIRAAARRVRAGALALVTFAAVAASVVLLNVLAPKFSRRLDVTATGEHRLAPRTEKLLGSLSGPYRVVLAGDLSRTDPRARDRVRDVLDQFARRSPNVAVTTIDAGTEAGQHEFDRLIASLAEAGRADLDAQRAAVLAAAEEADAFAAYLESGLSPALEAVRDVFAASPGEPGTRNADFFRDVAAAARNGAQDLHAAVSKVPEPLRATIRGVPAPATDQAARLLRDSLVPLAAQFEQLAKQLHSVQQSAQTPPRVKDLLGPLPASLREQRDRAATTADALARLPRPPIRRVADVLARGNAALVTGPSPTGMTAIPFESLFPEREWLDSAAVARADVGRRAEELFSSALASLETTAKPIVVIVHGESRTFFELGRFVTRIQERLALRGIDVIEWACVVQDDPPDLRTLNPDNTRPVVYASLAPNTAAGSGPAGEKPGVERAKKLGEVLNALAEAGKPLLISASPSVLAAFGQPDPTTGVLAAFGLNAETSKPILAERLTPRGRLVAAELSGMCPAGDHPIAQAIGGLPILFEWPVAINLSNSTGVTVTPLVSLTDPSSWGESQWSAIWASRGRVDRQADLPTYDRARDTRPASWLLAAAAERRTQAGTARLVAVGANTWFMDERSLETGIETRSLDAIPGNLELFEAAAYWLAGQDGLIAQTPQARAVALVRPITESQLKLVRGSVVLGLPLLVLIIGLAYRWVRG